MNKIAQLRWEKDIENYDLPHLRLRQVAELVKKINPASYTDLGCAKGTLRLLTPGIKYTGCDFAVPEGQMDFDFINCDFNREKLPGKINGELLITCSGLLEYIENIDAFLKNIHLILAENGNIIVSYFNMNHLSRIFEMASGKSFPVHPDWRGFYSPNDFMQKLAEAGFSIQKIIPVSHGFKNSAAVSATINVQLTLPEFRFYSKLLAHQLIYICKKNC